MSGKTPTVVALRTIVTLLLTAVVGCASASPSRWNGPTAQATAEIEPWTFTTARKAVPGKIIATDHYAIHTTVIDAVFLNSMAQLMEGAWQQYRALTPGLTPSEWPLTSYLFAERSEWAAFTADRTGGDAAIYLQINRGGYTVRDWFVSYYMGDTSTFAVAAHEGWHQFVARNFRTRLPPFLEEGIATTFENVRWSDGLPRWDLSSNLNRQQKLQRAITMRQLFPLSKLITMHAGDVVGMPPGKIEAFYAQDWAFALFMLNGNNGAHRDSLKRLLSDTANGTAYLKSELPHSVFPDAWQPSSVQPLLVRYLREDWPTIDAQYTAYIHRLADGSISDFAGQ